MAGQQSYSDENALKLFKNVYGDLRDILPNDQVLEKEIPFSESQMVGEKFIEAVVLTAETGITFGGSNNVAFTIEAAVAGAVRQAEITPSMTVLSSLIPFGVVSRSAGGGEKAFMDATKHLVRNNLRSHSKFQEIVRIYGQSPNLLGNVSFASATYRGVALVNGTGTINGVAFTNGVSATSILLAPGAFASGLWVGMEGVQVQEVDINGVVVAEGQLVGVSSEFGYITVDFTPVAASSITSHRLCFRGWASNKEAQGIHSILNRATTTLFAIPTSTFSLWKGTHITLSAEKFKISNLLDGVAAAVNGGGLEDDLLVLVNPRSWSKLITTEAGLRRYDSSYSSSEAENGFESITFYHQAGKAIIRAHRIVKEGEAYGLCLNEWSRSGSAEVSMEVPGINKPMLFPLENISAYCFRSFSDQYIFCTAPRRSILWDGINDESAS